MSTGETGFPGILVTFYRVAIRCQCDSVNAGKSIFSKINNMKYGYGFIVSGNWIFSGRLQLGSSDCCKKLTAVPELPVTPALMST